MGRQGDKGHKKSLNEAKEKHTEAKLKPRNGEKKFLVDENAAVNGCSVFSCSNGLMMIFTLVVAVAVTAVVAKAVELQHLNEELDHTIGKMKLDAQVITRKLDISILESKEKTVSDGALIKSLESEAEGLTAKLENTVSESKEQAVSDEALINSLDLEKTTLISKLDDLDVKFTNTDKKLKEHQASGEQLQKENKQQEKEIISLNMEIKTSLDGFEKERNDLKEKSEREIESMQGQINILSGENIDALKEVESIKINNINLSEDLLTKTETINSLREQNAKQSNDFSLEKDETSKTIVNLEEDKKTCFEDSKIYKKLFSEELKIKENIIENLISEKQDIEKTNEDKIETLAREHQHEVKLLEESKGTLMENLKNEKQEKHNLLNEKNTLEGSLTVLQGIMETTDNNLKRTDKDLETCEKDKNVLKDQTIEDRNKINILVKEKEELESKLKSKLESEKKELKRKISEKK